MKRLGKQEALKPNTSLPLLQPLPLLHLRSSVILLDLSLLDRCDG